MNEKPFNVIQATFPELYEWLKSISRYGEIDKFIIPDYKEPNFVKVTFYSHNYQYFIKAKKPTSDNQKGYLGCQAQVRKPIAGEDWTRGNDLPDGSYSEETWQAIMKGIIGYELVKVVKPKKLEKIDKI